MDSIASRGTTISTSTNLKIDLNAENRSISTQLAKQGGPTGMLKAILRDANSIPDKTDRIRFLENQFSRVDRFAEDARRGTVPGLTKPAQLIARAENVRNQILAQIEKMNKGDMRRYQNLLGHTGVDSNLARKLARSTPTASGKPATKSDSARVVSESGANPAGGISTRTSGNKANAHVVVDASGQRYTKKPETGGGNCGVMAVFQATKVAEAESFEPGAIRDELDAFRQNLELYRAADNTGNKCRLMGQLFSGNFERFKALALSNIQARLAHIDGDAPRLGDTRESLELQQSALKEAVGFEDLMNSAAAQLAGANSNVAKNPEKADECVIQILNKVDLNFEGLLKRTTKNDWLGEQDISALMLNRGYQLVSNGVPARHSEIDGSGTHTVLEFREILNSQRRVYIANNSAPMGQDRALTQSVRNQRDGGAHWVCVEPLVD